MRLSNILDNVSLNIKLLILALLALMATAVPTVIYIQSAGTSIASTALEIKGLEVNHAFLDALKTIQQHRGLASGVLNGNAQQAGELGVKAAEIDKLLAAYQKSSVSLDSAELNEKMGALLIKWSATKSSVNTKTIDAATSFDEHNAVIKGLFDVLWEVGAISGLWYDPEVASYHLIIASVDYAPKLGEILAQLRGIGNGILVAGTLDEKKRNSIVANIAYIDFYRENLILQLFAAHKANPELIGIVNSAKERLAAIDELVYTVEQEILNAKDLTLDAKVLWSRSTVVIDDVFEFNHNAADSLNQMMRVRLNRLDEQRNTTMVFLFVLILASGYLGVIIARSFKYALVSAQKATADIVNGQYDISLNTERKDEFGALNKAMLAMSVQLAEASKMQVENSRIRSALDSSSSNVMLADNERNIIYMNKAVTAMLRTSEPELRKALPHFSADNVIGNNIDIFHKNPSHQSNLLKNLRDTYVGNIVVAGLSFRLVVNPIFTVKGERLGSVVEWTDRTQEVVAEGEVNGVVQAAGAGDFKVRIPTAGKSGFFLTLAEGLNALMQTSDTGLGEVNRVLSALAKGDLTERISTDYAGTFGDLKDYCNQTTETLSEMMSEIRSAAETIYTASSEIASGNADLSSRTEQQAANLEETASSMEQLTSTVRLNADNAKQANVLASQASTVATGGGELIQQVVSTMSSINESSQKIADIIGVIDGIAFQTNILALNAAVEAARAGDQGRGFAVVAAEVRTLAQRSANAAKDIKSLISDSVKKIETGNMLVGKSGETMKDIVTSIKRVNDIMAEIAAASTEQSAGIEEVSTAVSHMDEMTQQNAALVEEAAAAAESLQSQADQLTQRVGEFKLSNDGGSPKSMTSSSARLASAGSKKPVASARKFLAPKNQDDEWESF